jgi:ABC-type sugar transport system substrate-binding protein
MAMAGKTWRKMGTVTAVAVLALVLAACNRGTSSGATGGGGGGGSSAGKIAAVIKGLDNPFFQAMQQGIEEQSKSQGTAVSVQAATSITDTTGQADKLNALAGQDYSCYLVNPISGTNLVQSLVQVSRKNKPIVNIDSPVDAKAAQAAGVKLATYVGTNNVNAGQMAGEQMLKELSGNGQVALIGGIPGDITSGARLDGFKKAVTGKLDIAQTVAADWDRQKALTTATDILRARPSLKGFFAANDDMGLGIVRAIQNAGKTGKVKVISVDGNKDALESVKQRQLTATVAQYPYAIGQMGMEACKAAASGKQLPANVEAPVLLVTKDVADKAISNFPKPFGTFNDPFKALAG